MKTRRITRRASSLFTLAALVVVLMSQSAIAQLIGEGDTLWYKDLYPNTITQVQFSPDGTKLGVVSYDNNYVGKFVMYNSMTGEELWTFQKATYYFQQFSFSKDGTQLYILPHSDRKISILEANTGNILDSLPINKGEGVNLEYNQVYQTLESNTLFLTNGSSDFALYDKIKKIIINEKIGSPINQVFVSPNSNYFINVLDYNSQDLKLKVEVTLWDVSSLSPIKSLGVEEAYIRGGGDIKISYNGKYAATNFGGRALQIWDLENKKLFKEYTPTIPTDSTDGRGTQNSLAFTHSNDIIVNCGGEFFRSSSQGRATTITNIVNDKRKVILDRMSGGMSIDIDKSDNFLAMPRSPRSILVYKLYKEGVPVKEFPEETIQILYPNPTTGEISIDIIGNQFVESVIINDLQGNEVTKISNNNIIQTNSKVSINLPKLNNGIYLLNLITNNGIISYKLIMEN